MFMLELIKRRPTLKNTKRASNIDCIRRVSEAAVILLFCLFAASTASASPASEEMLASGAFTHSFIHEYNGAETCLVCHRQAGNDVATSIHNTWMGTATNVVGKEGDETGKLTGVNDFHGAIKSNEDLCGKCHAGFGLPDDDLPVGKIDCLICHAPNYKKTATGPDPSIDVLAAVRGMVKSPTREMCLRCHATAGGGDNNKRGDLELAMGASDVSKDLDVHMSMDMTCQDCHTFEDHHVSGRGMDLRVDDTATIVSCDDAKCHGSEPHPGDSMHSEMYNRHTGRLYCTACHITTYGKVTSAEVSRDWENRTLGADGMYHETIVRESNPAPIHVWWNRMSEIMDLADPAVLDDGVVVMAKPVGELGDPTSRIYAARLHRGRQPWNNTSTHILPFKVMTVRTTNGMTRAIFDATGETHDPVQYVNTTRYMGLFHGVSPKEDALTCNDCHDDHKLDYEALGYNVEKDASGDLISVTKPGSTANFATISGKDCISCHRIGGILPEKFQIDVQAMNRSDAIHYDLNRDAEDELDPNNVRCWACHGDGDGSEAAQPSSDHPGNYDNPKNCSGRDCHSINQSVFNEPMVYEHFMYADVLDNEGDVLPTENISTGASCDSCHINSIMENLDPDHSRTSDISLVSHYGSTYELMAYPDFVMTDCVYCHEGHYKEDWGEGISGDWGDEIREEWGDAIDPMDQETEMIEDEGDEYSKTMFAGDLWELRNGYILKVTAVDLNGDNAHIQLSRDGELLEEEIVHLDYPYEYEREITDDDGKTFNQTDIRLNMTGIMRSSGGVVAIFEGQTIKRIHRETRNSACYACHAEGYARNNRYTLVDRLGDMTYYTTMLVDFGYYGDNMSKTLATGEEWDLGDGFTLTAKQIDIDGDLARIELARDGVAVEDDVVHTDEMFYYEDDFHATNVYYDDEFHAINDSHTFHDLRIFRANVSGIFRSEDTDLMVLRDVRLISPDISAVDAEDIEGDNGFRLDGYNLSWIRVGEDFGGREPFTLHEAPLHNGRAINFADCVHCHDLGSGMDIKRVDAITSQLRAHAGLNENASSKTVLSDPIDKTCWACHGTGTEPDVHPDKKPKECVDCHVNKILYGAVDLSDEAHGQAEGCNRCHAADYPGLHVISVFKPNKPNIVGLNAIPEVAMSGQLVNMSATAVAGWNMKVEAMEYFIGEEGLSGTGTAVAPVDGAFDEQTEEFEFTINTTGLEPGEHAIYVHAMERGKWGPMNRAAFAIEFSEPASPEPESPKPAMAVKPERHLDLPAINAAAVIIIGIGAWLLLTLRRKRGL